MLFFGGLLNECLSLVLFDFSVELPLVTRF